jgi:hypothetical protein
MARLGAGVLRRPEAAMPDWLKDIIFIAGGVAALGAFGAYAVALRRL